jgi:hypothetical protein
MQRSEIINGDSWLYILLVFTERTGDLSLHGKLSSGINTGKSARVY